MLHRVFSGVKSISELCKWKKRLTTMSANALFRQLASQSRCRSDLFIFSVCTSSDSSDLMAAYVSSVGVSIVCAFFPAACAAGAGFR
jgi:hypothetical protein